MKRFSSAIVLTVLALLVAAGGALAAELVFKARMKPDIIVPLPVNVDSQAKGEAEFELSEDGQSMQYELEVKRIDHVTAAHIHKFVSEGSNGPVLVWLYPTTSPGAGTPTGVINGELISGSFGPANVQNGFTWAQVIELIQSGQAYVNVHTSEAPAGEINGHIH